VTFAIVETRRIGKVGLRVSELTLGTWGLATGAYGSTDPGDFTRCVKFAIDIGITTFDCAPTWGDGESERLVGEATSDRRDKVVYITRVSAAVSEGDVEGFHRRCEEEVEASLGRLGTDHIDIVLVNHPESDLMDLAGWADGLRALVDAGKVRAWGVSTSRASAARLALLAGPEVLCIPYNLLHSRLLEEISGELTDASCGVIARSPLAYGLLANDWGKYHRFDKGDHRRDRWSPQAFEKRLHQAQSLRFLIQGEVDTMTSAALRYVLAHPVVVTAAVGARTPQQVLSAAKMIGAPPYLPEDDLVEIQQVIAATEG